MANFRTTRRGVRLILDPMETQLLRQLIEEFSGLLGTGRTDRGDPVYDRLFPSAYELPKDEAAYRELIGNDLEQHKLAAAQTVHDALGKRKTDVTIEDDDFETWIQHLTDLRLALGTRLEIDEPRMEAEIDPSDPDAQAMFVLHWLGFVQPVSHRNELS